MTHTRLRTLALLLLVAAGMLAASPRPSFACHSATGMCCTNGGHEGGFCCWFDSNKIVRESCGT